jgi:hypothetical protein
MFKLDNLINSKNIDYVDLTSKIISKKRLVKAKYSILEIIVLVSDYFEKVKAQIEEFNYLSQMHSNKIYEESPELIVFSGDLLEYDLLKSILYRVFKDYSIKIDYFGNLGPFIGTRMLMEDSIIQDLVIKDTILL